MRRITSITLTAAMLIMIFCSATITSVCASSQFSDVQENHWAYKQITELVNRGILSGYDDGTFKPNNDVTRAEWATIMTVAFHLYPPENIHLACENNIDLPKTHWAAPYMLAAENYFTSYTDSEGGVLFYPEMQATREDVAVSLVRYIGFNPEDADLSYLFAFDDDKYVGEKNYIALAIEHGIIQGYEDNTLKPLNTLSRAEAAALIYRLMDYDKFTIIDNTKLNNIYIGQAADEVISILGEPDFKSEIEWQWINMFYQEWRYNSSGLVIRMARKNGQQTINGIFVTQPCDMLTEKGIGIGSTGDDIISKYGEFISNIDPITGNILVGSVYGGIYFTLDNDIITAIYIGSMVESAG